MNAESESSIRPEPMVPAKEIRLGGGGGVISPCQLQRNPASNVLFFGVFGFFFIICCQASYETGIPGNPKLSEFLKDHMGGDSNSGFRIPCSLAPRAALQMDVQPPFDFRKQWFRWIDYFRERPLDLVSYGELSKDLV